MVKQELKKFFEYLQDKIEDCNKKETESAIKEYLQGTEDEIEDCNHILLMYEDVKGYDSYEWFGTIEEMKEHIKTHDNIAEIWECIDCTNAISIELEDLEPHKLNKYEHDANEIERNIKAIYLPDLVHDSRQSHVFDYNKDTNKFHMATDKEFSYDIVCLMEDENWYIFHTETTTEEEFEEDFSYGRSIRIPNVELESYIIEFNKWN